MENAGSEIPTLCQQLLYCTKIGVLVNIGVKMPAIVVTVTGLGVIFFIWSYERVCLQHSKTFLCHILSLVRKFDKTP